MTKLRSFLKALLRHWWLLLFSALSAISTANSYVPQFHIPKLLPFGIALVLVFVASFRAYGDLFDAMELLRREKDQISEFLVNSETTRIALAEQLGDEQRARAQVLREKESVVNENKRLDDVINGLHIQILDLKKRPYDQQKFARAKELIDPLRYIERDILRLLVLNADCRGDVFYYQRIKVTETFDSNGHIKPLREAGLVTVIGDHLTGYSTYKLNQNYVELLKDLLFPRNEGDNKPFFKGL
jgi:hypothetical protein